MLETGVITKTSKVDFEQTYQQLRTVIDNNPNLKIIAELNHQGNAATVDLELLPTRIIMFGNPRLGTPLMQNAQTIGLDLPQKILVYQEASGTVKVAYNDPLYLKNRHGITENAAILEKISGALNKLTEVAISV